MSNVPRGSSAIFLVLKRKNNISIAKDGRGVAEVIKRIIIEVPAPQTESGASLKAILFDSLYDPYRGVILFLRVSDGIIRCKDKILMMHRRSVHEIEEVGVFLPQAQKKDFLGAGEVGYICCGIKNPQDVDMGDTITSPPSLPPNLLRDIKKYRRWSLRDISFRS